MDFADKLMDLAKQVPLRLQHIETEEATKNAFVMPFIATLGYDIFNPSEVVPEFTADVGIKRGEKVDYAVMQAGKPIMLFEVKSIGSRLSISHASQLYRYFSVTDARFAILTDGVEYRFHSDIEQPNKMDEKPFLVISLTDLKPEQIEELKRFTKGIFNEESIASIAGELKYTREIKRVLAQEMIDPDDEFIKVIAGRVYSGRFTQNVVEQFSKFVVQAFKDVINERIATRLQTALDTTDTKETEKVEVVATEPKAEAVEDKPSRTIVTTEDEIEGYHIIKSILRTSVDAKRIAMRDTQSYCSVLLDDNNRKPVARMWFNTNQYYLGTFDSDKNETRHPIADLDDIYKLEKLIKAAVENYDKE